MKRHKGESSVKKGKQWQVNEEIKSHNAVDEELEENKEEINEDNRKEKGGREENNRKRNHLIVLTRRVGKKNVHIRSVLHFFYEKTFELLADMAF